MLLHYATALAVMQWVLQALQKTVRESFLYTRTQDKVHGISDMTRFPSCHCSFSPDNPRDISRDNPRDNPRDVSRDLYILLP